MCAQPDSSPLCLQTFGEAEFLKYQSALAELATVWVNLSRHFPTAFPITLIPSRNVNYAPLPLLFLLVVPSIRSLGSGSPSQQQQHQSAAKDLTSSEEAASCCSSPTQSTYLTSAVQQRNKRPRHFLELKNFKDNYNTLDSSFWYCWIVACRLQSTLVHILKKEAMCLMDSALFQVPVDGSGYSRENG